MHRSPRSGRFSTTRRLLRHLSLPPSDRRPPQVVLSVGVLLRRDRRCRESVRVEERLARRHAARRPRSRAFSSGPLPSFPPPLHRSASGTCGVFPRSSLSTAAAPSSCRTFWPFFSSACPFWCWVRNWRCHSFAKQFYSLSLIISACQL